MMFNFLWKTAQNYRDDFFEAVELGNVEDALYAATGFPINKIDEETGQFPIFYALEKKQLNIAKELVSHELVSVDVKYPKGHMYANKCMIEAAVDYAVHEKISPYEIALLNYLSKGECFYSEISSSGPQTTLYGYKCYQQSKLVDCNNLNKECFLPSNSEKCDGFEVYPSVEEVYSYKFTYKTIEKYSFDKSFEQNNITELVPLQQFYNKFALHECNEKGFFGNLQEDLIEHS